MLVQPSASVSRDPGTDDWVSATEEISVGATASPLTISRPATAAGWSTNSSGTTEAASSTAPTRNRRRGDTFQWMVPVTRPATSEPMAQTIKMAPE